VFTGEHSLNIDDKGRLAVPARFRQQLAESQGLLLYITINDSEPDHPRLEIYPAPKFREIADQIDRLDDRGHAEMLKLRFIGRAVETEIDKQGRIMLPPLLRRDARLNGRVTLLGQINRFDVWDETLYAQARAPSEALAEALRQIRR
jgi:MraZ protein